MLPRSRLETTARVLGLELQPADHRVPWLAGLGTVLSIALIGAVTHRAVGPSGSLWIVPSLGATAVLVFAAPHAPLSQPWNVVVGHLVSAVVGVAAMRTCGDVSIVLATAVAAGLSVTAMAYLRAIHPPGGATAMIAVLGGEPVRALEFGYALSPILVCVALMLLTAFVFHGRSQTQRYPAGLSRERHRGQATTDARHPGSGGPARPLESQQPALAERQGALEGAADANLGRRRREPHHGLGDAPYEWVGDHERRPAVQPLELRAVEFDEA